MTTIILTLIFLLSTSLLIMLMLFSIFWLTHRSMTINNSDTWGYGTFKNFKIAFSILDWERDEAYPESYFGGGEEYYKNKIHAEIIKFEGKGMVLYPWSYIKFIFWSKKNSLNKQNNIKKRVNWKF